MEFRWINVKNGKSGSVHAVSKVLAKRQLSESGIRSEYCFVEEKYMELVKGGKE